MQKNVYAVAVLGFDDDRSLGSSETSRLALPVFQELMIGVYREQIVGPRPAFPVDGRPHHRFPPAAHASCRNNVARSGALVARPFAQIGVQAEPEDGSAGTSASTKDCALRARQVQFLLTRTVAQLQRFTLVHGVVQNLFRVGRHLLRSAHHRPAPRAGVRRMGCGDVRPLNEREAPTSRERSAHFALS